MRCRSDIPELTRGLTSRRCPTQRINRYDPVHTPNHMLYETHKACGYFGIHDAPSRLLNTPRSIYSRDTPIRLHDTPLFDFATHCLQFREPPAASHNDVFPSRAAQTRDRAHGGTRPQTACDIIPENCLPGVAIPSPRLPFHLLCVASIIPTRRQPRKTHIAKCHLPVPRPQEQGLSYVQMNCGKQPLNTHCP
jgi:hypothetical protein